MCHKIDRSQQVMGAHAMLRSPAFSKFIKIIVDVRFNRTYTILVTTYVCTLDLMYIICIAMVILSSNIRSFVWHLNGNCMYVYTCILHGA